MAEIQQIPIDSTFPSFKIRTELEGVSYILRFDWNGRSERWHMGIYDSDETPIQVGLVMNINWDMIGRFAELELPPGLLMLYDTSGRNEEAGRNDLGDRCVLIYQTSE